MIRISIFIFLAMFSIQSLGMSKKLDWNQAVERAVNRYGLRTEPELKRFFEKADVAYPPREIALLAFKQERHVELWAKTTSTSSWRHIHTYPLTTFSGRLGPKLKAGDKQIPEGIYRLNAFNPYSSMHLSIHINYPNDFDRLQAAKDGRKNLGGDIFIHGKNLSVGCLAIGDRAIDQIFLLAHRVGLNNTKVIIAPNDLRASKPATSHFAQPRWLPELYRKLHHELAGFYKSKYMLAKS